MSKARLNRLVKVLLVLPLVLMALSLILQPDVYIYQGETLFDGDNAYGILQYITANFKNRVVGTDADREIAYWIADYFESLGLETHVDVFKAPSFGGGRVDAYNVYAIKRGSTDAYILLMAHHDIVPWTTEGANDNGGGLAVLIELARVFANRDTKHGIIFLSPDAEETGLHGSERFAATFSGEVVAAISIDMCTWKDHEGVAPYAFMYPPSTFSDGGIVFLLQKAGSVGGAAKVLGTDIAVATSRLLLIIGGTDSMPFVKRGVVALGIVDWPLYPYWHKPEDSIDKVSSESLREVGVLVERLVLSIDRGGVPVLTRQYLFLSDKVIPGAYIYCSWLAILIAVSLAVIGLLGRGVLGQSVKVFSMFLALYLLLSLSSMLAIYVLKTALPVLVVVVALSVLICRAVSGKWLSRIGAEALKLSSLFSASVLVALGMLNPSLAILLLLPLVYAIVSARPIKGRKLRMLCRVILPVLALITPIAIIIAGSAMLGLKEFDHALSNLVAVGLRREPYLVVALFAAFSIPASGVSSTVCLLSRAFPGEQ